MSDLFKVTCYEGGLFILGQGWSFLLFFLPMTIALLVFIYLDKKYPSWSLLAFFTAFFLILSGLLKILSSFLVPCSFF